MPAESVDAWLDKAEEDFRLASLAMRQRKQPLYAGACLHSQQCAEKYLKGFLVRHKIPFRKTHDLDELLRLCTQVDPTFKLISRWTPQLTPYAIDVRYPGGNPTGNDARQAVEAMKEIRDFVRSRLGLRKR